MRDISYKGHVLSINELELSSSFCNNSKLYRGVSVIGGKDWKVDAVTIERIVEVFKSRIDNLEMNKAYEQICQSWGSDWKKVTYKNWSIGITVRRRYVDHQLVYLGEFRDKNYNNSSIESTHYDKVVSRFQRFVDEYCTDWVVSSSVDYKNYCLVIKRDRNDSSSFFGTCEIHKNSTFKCISKSVKEIEEKFKARIDKVLMYKGVLLDKYKGYELEISFEPTISYPYLGKKPWVGRVRELLLSWRSETPEDIKKEFREYFDKKGMGKVVEEDIKQRKMLTPKQEKIQELEQLQARISAQLEELKKEKDILTYKGIVLEYGVEEGLQEGYMVGRIKNAPEGTLEIYGRTVEAIKSEFEEYVDELEKSHYIFNMIRPEIKNRY